MKFKATSYPTNKKDKVLFASLESELQESIIDRVEQLYDGTRTLAACWKQAMDELVTGRIK